MKKGVAIVFGITSDYTFALANVLIGLKKQGSNFWDDIIVFHDGIEDSDKNALDSILPCSFIEYTKEFLRNNLEELPATKEYSLMALSRFECFELLKKYRKVMWHDVDILIQNDIQGLLGYSEKTGYAATQSDTFRVEQNFYEIIDGYDMLPLLYNSGILVLSDKLLELGDLRTYCYEKYNKYAEKIRYSDQAVLNMMIQDFNITVEIIKLEKYCCHPSNVNYRKASIIHAYGKSKFWNSDRLKRQFPEWVENNALWIDIRQRYSKFTDDMPLVTVIMSVYDRSEYLHESIESILKQTYRNFELLIIVEASENQEIICAKIEQIKDPRIVIIRNLERLGFANSLNVGLCKARGKYIARMDDDDISLPNRLSKEVDFLEKNDQIAIVGGWIRFFGKYNHEEHRPTMDEQLRVWAIKESPFFHPTVMMRKSVLDEFEFRYDARWFTEDYDLWLRMLPQVQVANIPEVVLLYRASGNNITSTRAADVMNSHLDLMRRNLKQTLGLEFSRDEMHLLRYPSVAEGCYNLAALQSIHDEVLIRIYKANLGKHVYDQKILEDYLGKADISFKSTVKAKLNRFPKLYSVIRKIYRALFRNSEREIKRESFVKKIKMRLLPASSKSFHKRLDAIEKILNWQNDQISFLQKSVVWADAVIRRTFQANQAAFWKIFSLFPNEERMNEFKRNDQYRRYICALYVLRYALKHLKIRSVILYNCDSVEWQIAAATMNIEVIQDKNQNARCDLVVGSNVLGVPGDILKLCHKSDLIIYYADSCEEESSTISTEISYEMNMVKSEFAHQGYNYYDLKNKFKDNWEMKKDFMMSLGLFVRAESWGSIIERLEREESKEEIV